MSFLPTDYTQPKAGGNYLRFQEGQNKFRIIGNAILGWEDWTLDNKPVRTPFNQPKPSPIKPERSVKHFWAFPVWDYAENKVKILEITQSGIQGAINDLFKNADWGSPFKFDIVVTKTGKELETKYTVMPVPHKELTAEIQNEIKNTPVRVEALFTGEDPFEVKQTPAEIVQSIDEQVEENVDNIPF